MLKSLINIENSSNIFKLFTAPIVLQIISSIANLLPALYLVKFTGLSEFGKYSLCFMILMISREFFIAMILTPMGILLPKISVHRLSAYRSILTLNLLIFIFISSFFIFFIISLIAFYSQLNWFLDILIIIIFGNFATCSCEFLKRYFLITSRDRLAITLEVFKLLLYLALLFFIESLGHLTYQNALNYLTFSLFISSFFGLFFFGTLSWSSFLVKGVMLSHAKFIKWNGVTTFAKSFMNSSPIFILGVLFGEAYVGLFRSCQQITNSVQIPIIALSQLGSSRASNILKTKGINQFHTFLRQIFLLALIIVVPIIILVIASSQPIQSFLNINSDEFLLIIVILIFGNLIIVARLPVLVYLEVMQLPNLIAYSQILSLILGFPVAFILISKGDTIAAASCYIIFNGLSLIFMEFFFKTKQKESMF